MKKTNNIEYPLPDVAINIETIVKIITYLVGILGFLSIFMHINTSFSIMFLALFVFSLYFEYKKTFYFPRWLLNILSLLVILFSIHRFKLEDLVTQILEALLILLAIKFMENKKFRDYMQIYAITLFLLAGLGLLSLDITFIVYLLILVFLLTASIVLLTYYSQDSNLTFTKQIIIKIILKSMYIPMVAIPLSILMFMILPRTQYPIFNFMNRTDKAKTGFTDNVRLGVVSSIQEDSSAILRVNMEKIDDNSLYWRGVVLDYFSDNSWKSSKKEAAPVSSPGLLKGKGIRQIIYLEPYENRYLFALDKPINVVQRDTRKYDDFTIASMGNIDKRIRYEAVSIITDTIDETKIDEDKYLQLPTDLSPEIIKLVKNIAVYKNKTQNIQSIYTFLNAGTYKYSIENLPVTSNPLEDFLFFTKFGNCEYFASAFAVMLRVAGIPSRVVGGYKGGYYNDLGGYYLVPQKNAHVWVEAYIHQKGWVRIDPTPGIIDHFAPLMKGDVFFRLSVLLDTINYYWYATVINYNFEKQFFIIQSLRSNIKKPSFKTSINKDNITKSLIIVIIIAGLVFAVYSISKLDNSFENKLLISFLRTMEKHGYKKLASEGLEEFVLNIGQIKISEHAHRFVKEFEKIYYKDKQFSTTDRTKLKKIINQIKRC